MRKKVRIVNPARFRRFVLIVLIAAVLIAGCFWAARPVRDGVNSVLYPLEYRSLIEKYSRERELPESLVAAVIRCESGFDPSATSSIGARGLMQFTSDTFDWVCYRLDGDETFSDMYDPETAIRYGTYLLRYLTDTFETTPEVLAAYHAGMNQVSRWLEDPEYSSDGRTLSAIPFADTESYVVKVSNTVGKYQELYGLS